MIVSLLSWTHDPELIVATAAKTCYSPGTTEEMYKSLWYKEEEISSFVKKLQNMGHLSPFEHASFTFGIDGVSRVLLAQLTRHRIASFSVQSQRYVKYSAFNDAFNVPDSINSDDSALNIYLDAILHAENSYNKLTELGIKAEDARYLLPNAAKTNLVMTMNARQLMHFFELRCCNRAQDEIRELAWCIYAIVGKKFPSLFSNCGPKCLTDKCGEGKMSCGKPYKKES